MTARPTHRELLASLDGCSDALVRLMDAVRDLFDSASTADGYAAAVNNLRAAHDAAVDWCGKEADRYTDGAA